MRIAIFDSGVGGVTVLHEAMNTLPRESFLYYADTDNVPYGTKTKEEVRNYIFAAVERIAQFRIKALVLACNTATAVAVNDLRARYDFPILGMEPAVKPAVAQRNGRRVLVTATPLTLCEEKFQHLVSALDVGDIVDTLALPGLVEFAENFDFDDETVDPYLRGSLRPFNLDDYGTIVLGCTHFPFFRDHFRRLVPDHIDLIDGNRGTVAHLARLLAEKSLAATREERPDPPLFLTSGRIEPPENRYRRYLALL